jgi:hypothetical protein
MLLLKEDQVQFQDVINSESEQPTPIIGVFYQNRLYKQLKSCSKDKLESAQQLARQLSLDPEFVC